MSTTAATYRYIIRTPEVCGGCPRIENTRITVHAIVAYHLLGSSIEEIADRFLDISRAQIYECLAFYEDHREEIEALALSQLQNGNP